MPAQQKNHICPLTPNKTEQYDQSNENHPCETHLRHIGLGPHLDDDLLQIMRNLGLRVPADVVGALAHLV
jgi:hypothetical protein